MLKSIEGNFNHPEVNQLLKKHFVELRAASPEGSAHVLETPGLKVPSIKNHGEFKSIRVHHNFRGKGNGIKVINHLIDEAKKLKIKRLSIETGAAKFFAPARKLFTNSGFKPCPPFAHYKKDVNSLYLTKLLDNN